MDYVCTVVGNLYIKDLNIELSYMEIIDFSQEDLKQTPQLRECIRNKQLDVYIPKKYPMAKKYRNRNSDVKLVIIPKEPNSLKSEDFLGLSKNINEISERLSLALDKIDILIRSFKIPEITVKNEENPMINNLLVKIDKLIEVLTKNNDSAKFDLLLNKFDNFLSNNSSNSFMMRENTSGQNKIDRLNDETPIYVPELNLEGIGKKSIKTQELSSEGTDDILEKLRKLKKGD